MSQHDFDVLLEQEGTAVNFKMVCKSEEDAKALYQSVGQQLTSGYCKIEVHTGQQQGRG